MLPRFCIFPVAVMRPAPANHARQTSVLLPASLPHSAPGPRAVVQDRPIRAAFGRLERDAAGMQAVLGLCLSDDVHVQS